MSFLFWFFSDLAGGGLVRGPVGLSRLCAGRYQHRLRQLVRAEPEPRLAVTEQATVDSRRRLVLVRRDDVEHLIMTGGPVDVVIETDIAVRHVSIAEAPAHAAPVFSRPPRSFGQAVNE